MRTFVLEMLVLLRGIIRFLCKALLIILTLVLILHLAFDDLQLSVMGYIAVLSILTLLVLIMVGYDKLIQKLLPEDTHIQLPF